MNPLLRLAGFPRNKTWIVPESLQGAKHDLRSDTNLIVLMICTFRKLQH